ncbi:MAG: hypothetical protein MB55_00530 [marine actinobacterium MedAcidi-G3]|nr:MAG: hypothetical protein MB55_00530 [marine actinobacterium MedAcidi-G3]MAR54935.1 hypothetical protein [Acidimicrobiaceae bacterium]MBA4812389.1 hypothetical protein [Acidimicrobiales bacterium]OUW86871.1 MAG: hypothetical protein CBD84_03850 [Acidimicrobiaceae bacterium TMED224]
MARPKKPKSARKPKRDKLDSLPDKVKQAIEAKQSQQQGRPTTGRSAGKNTGYGGGAPKRTGGRDR